MMQNTVPGSSALRGVASEEIRVQRFDDGNVAHVAAAVGHGDGSVDEGGSESFVKLTSDRNLLPGADQLPTGAQ